MLPAIAAGVLGLKGLFDSARKQRQQQAQAVADARAIQFSPWSGLDTSKLVGKDYSTPSTLSGLIEGAATGYSTGQNIENALEDQKTRQLKNEFYKSKIPAKEVASVSNPYSQLELALEEPDYLKGQAVRRMPYGMGVGDV